MLGARPAALSRWLSVAWALSPILFGITAGPYALWAGRRTHRRDWINEGYLDLAITAGWIALLASTGDSSSGNAVGGFVVIAQALVGTARALSMRRAVQAQLPASSPTANADAAPTPWRPEAFPIGSTQGAIRSPAASSVPIQCDGQDAHDPYLSPRQYLTGAVVFVLGGAVLNLLYSNGSGLTLGAVCAVMYAGLAAFHQRLDGPVVIYRRWGVRGEFRLDTATAVRVVTPGFGRTLAIYGPDSSSRIHLRLRMAHVVSPEVRAHLGGWLLRDGVTISPDLAAWLKP